MSRAKKKIPTQYTKVLETLHIVCGVFITLFATIHGTSNIHKTMAFSVMTGLISLILLLAIICIIVIHILSRQIE